MFYINMFLVVSRKYNEEEEGKLRVKNLRAYLPRSLEGKPVGRCGFELGV